MACVQACQFHAGLDDAGAKNTEMKMLFFCFADNRKHEMSINSIYCVRVNRGDRIGAHTHTHTSTKYAQQPLLNHLISFSVFLPFFRSSSLPFDICNSRKHTRPSPSTLSPPSNDTTIFHHFSNCRPVNEMRVWNGNFPLSFFANPNFRRE